MIKQSYIIKLVVLSLLLAILICFRASGNTLKGKITDVNGNPVSYATIFIKELSQGTTTNYEGFFEIEVPEGVYTLNFRRLGFIPKIKEVEVNKPVVEINIIMEEYVQEIKEVRVYGTGEDPAYPIMRKVIGLASYNQNKVDSYVAELYMRGTVKLDNVPGLMRGYLRRQDIPVKSGDVFVDESYSKVTFKAPDEYHQEVTSINTTFPEAADVSLVEWFGSSLYLDHVYTWISPLAPNAFAHYEYTYEDYQIEGGYTIDKIKVTPKRNSKQLFEGYIYIIDNLWCLYSAELTFRNAYGVVTAKQVFDEVKPTIWLPVSYDLFFKGGVLKVKGTIRLVASVKYIDLRPNYELIALRGDSIYLQKVEPIKEESSEQVAESEKEPVTKKEILRKQKVEKILDKSEISNVDMHRLSKIIEQEAMSNYEDTVKSLQLTEKATREIRKGAESRDSSYWASKRAIPLSPNEIESFDKRDSLQRRTGGKGRYIITPEKKTGTFRRHVETVFFGRDYQNRDTTLYTHYHGVINANSIGFNVVDGWHYSQELTIRKELPQGNYITFNPRISWAFSRKAFMWGNNTTFTYSPLKRGLLSFSFGKFTRDFNISYPVNPILNAITSIGGRENYARYFEDRFIDLNNRIDLANGLVLHTGLEWHDYKRLENTTDWPAFNNQYFYYPNIPNNDEVSDNSLDDQRGTILKLRLEYTPRYFYYIRKGKKEMSHSHFPTFHIAYNKGIKNIFGSDSNFDYLEAGLKQQIEAGPQTSVLYEFRGGWFPRNEKIHFSEFIHTNTHTIRLQVKEHRHAWTMPDYYQLATSKYFAEGHISLKAPFIAIKYLPLIRNTTWRETVRLSYYSKPGYANYFELEYSMIEILLIGDIGVTAAWENWKFKNVGVNLVIRLSKE